MNGKHQHLRLVNAYQYSLVVILTLISVCYNSSASIIEVDGRSGGVHEVDGYDKSNQEQQHKNLEQRLYLWSRGDIHGRPQVSAEEIAREGIINWGYERLYQFVKLGPVRKVRQEHLLDNECIEFESACLLQQMNNHNNRYESLLNIRGGGSSATSTLTSYKDRLDKKIQQLTLQFGPQFKEAIALNEKEHEEDCEISCQSYYCASASSENTNSSSTWNNGNDTSFLSYNFGAVPPEDFADEFGFPLDLIKVSQGEPLFTSQEANDVIQAAEDEGVDKNEYTSGKYKLGGDWLTNLPQTRSWFNKRLQNTFFPLLADLFPEIVSSESVLRAHSVSLLKYNSSHPRTDVHIDNGILAMTVAMTPKNNYVGGGTFFEHMDDPIPMDVGHITVRPGSVRHGGHKVTKGTRYILGAFLLIKDRVEHVRRLKNRGSELRRKQDLDNASKHFEWALAINPKCTTCLKDWAEILMSQKRYTEAELKLREALRLLEYKDSDALFSLGVILSAAGKNEESIDAYKQSVELNADDAELCYNLGIKLGERGDKQGEMTMYARATRVDPKFGGAWLNWGTTLAESGNFDDAEVMFLSAAKCPEVRSKALMNLAMVYLKQGESNAANGDLPKAKDLVTKAADNLEDSKRLLDEALANGSITDDEKRYIQQFRPLRIQCHRLAGSVLFGMKDLDACEKEFRAATDNFPDIQGPWEMLARVLELQGKNDEVALVRETINQLKR